MNRNDNTLSNRIQQFQLDQMQTTVAATPAVVQKKTDPLPSTSQNAYVQARCKILTGYTPFKRQEIADMEKTGDINNRFYAEFVHEVAVLGDQLHG